MAPVADFAPADLDLDVVLDTLDLAFYPTPTAGFKARTGVLLALTASYIVLSTLYLIIHVVYSKDRPRYKSLWLLRVVERPSGRFLVLNSRLTWTTWTVLYGCFELAHMALYYRVYVCHESQSAWFVVRALNAPFLFIPGWLTSWSGLQSFLVATELNGSRLLPTCLANLLFAAGGLLLFALNLGLGLASAILGVHFWHSYKDFRSAIIAARASLAGRSPTLADFAQLRTPHANFVKAGKDWRTPTVWQFAVVALLPAAVLLVNLGGLALARRLHLQIRDSVEVLALVDGRNKSLSKPVPLDDPAAGDRPSSVTGSLPGGVSQLDFVDLPGAKGGAAAAPAAAAAAEGSAAKKDKRKSSLTRTKVKDLARQRDSRGEATPAQKQARQVLALQKAKRDLIMIASTIAVVSALLLVDAILLAIWSGKQSIYKGRWPITEAAISLPCWIYSTAIFVSTGYLVYNAIRHGRISPALSSEDHTFSRRPPAQPATPPTSSLLAGFVDHARSASITSAADPLDPAAGGEVPVPRDEEAAAETAPPPHSPSRSHRRGASTGTASTGISSAGGRRGLHKASWIKSAGGHSRAGSGGGGGAGSRPSSVVGHGIIISVETEQRCDGDTCYLWRPDSPEEEYEVGRFGRGGGA
ncbi:hypothetical protein JCM10213_004720 [Rhodosporidiobolus nylandii]